MPAAAGDSLDDQSPGELRISGSEITLPFSVAHVSRESIRNFHHTKRVGSYLIGRKLGEGSFAKVREGLHVLTGEKVAVKVIDKKKAKKDSYVTKNLRREGQIHQMIRHPNITQLLDILETENSYYLVMELCTGGNLMHKMYDKKILEEAEARRYIRQLTLAVEHLHRAGVVHRDLKIENLLLDEENNIKLIDFGLSNCAGILGYSDPFSTQCGSPAYAAPELLARKKYGPKVDIWSIGVNTYAMLTGTLPFTVEPFSLRALHQKMVDKDLNPLPVHLSSAAINFLLSLLEPDPIKRPNIQQVLSDHWLNDDSSGIPTSRTPTSSMAYSNRLHPEDLNQSVVLHMTEKMGYKHAEVVNTVLSNRASHTLSIYFLLNRKLDHYFKSIGKADFADGICCKDLLHQCDKYRLKEMQEEKKTKDPGKRVDVIQKPFPRKAEKGFNISKQSPCFLAPVNSSKVAQTDRKVTKAERGLLPEACRPTGSIPVGGTTSSKNGYLKSPSLEYLEMHRPQPRTPLPIRQHEHQPLCLVSSKRRMKDLLPIATTGHHPGMGQEQQELLPQQRDIRSTQVIFSASTEQHECLSPSKSLSHPAHTVPMYDGRKDILRPQRASLIPSNATNAKSNELTNPYLVKSRGKFPMMGIGQMLRKRNEALQLRTDSPIDVSGHMTPKSNIIQKILYTAGSLQPQCSFHS
ncbi:hormonally up-regulated neu tumor-associated kinase homolog A isoform X1 [Hypanus sabinus]|uniref:hormonally up-regulated neu tumor-associated kinase homolog A isoform X1 n=2 Tax=Hypanus sabinus TaxID=79690 RepID=UPI0028C38ACE|nr:hormonally up-regulated neu tumor-associated kinase homolog A isoform X1 [Hypanus sabinus]